MLSWDSDDENQMDPSLFKQVKAIKKNCNVSTLCVYLQIFLCMLTIWRRKKKQFELYYYILYIMAKHTKDESAFHHAQQCVAD